MAYELVGDEITPPKKWTLKAGVIIAVVGALTFSSMALFLPTSETRAGIMTENMDATKPGEKVLTPSTGYRIKVGIQHPEYRMTEQEDENLAVAEASSNYISVGDGSITRGPGTALFAAVNEYGEMSQHTRNLYGYEHIVEPHKLTTFIATDTAEASACCTVDLYWSLRRLTIGSGGDDTITSVPVEVHKGDSFSFTAKGPNEWYSVTLVETMVDKKTQVARQQRSYTSSSIVSKFVRRELRSLSETDREAIFAAMEEQYLNDFQSILSEEEVGEVSDVTLFALLHNKVGACFHDGPQFITAHPAMQLLFEQSLRKASLDILGTDLSSTFYWDFTVEGDTMGPNWPDSIIYSDDWFGAVKTAEEDNWQMTTGRFANATMKRWKGPRVPFLEDKDMYSPYGFLSDPCISTTSEVIQRSTSFCGIETKQTMPPMTNIVKCLEAYDTLQTIEACLETNVHANLHSLHGGAWECGFDMQALADSDSHKYPQRVLDFISVDNFNPWYKYARSYNYYQCTEGDSPMWPCDVTDGMCGGPGEFKNWGRLSKNESEIWKEGNLVMAFYSGAAQGSGFVQSIGGDSDDLDSLGHKMVMDWNAKYKWKHLPMSEQTDFMRFVLEFWSHPGKVGVAATGASPTDPLFWTWHGIFDKIMHVLRLSSDYDDKDLTWTSTATSHCGGHWLDQLPMKNIFIDAPIDVHFDNKALWELLDPSREHLPYVYDQFTKWGATKWDACPSCT